MIFVTPGEPAGIGPDCTLMAATLPWDFPWVAIADAQMLRDRAAALGLAVSVVTCDEQSLPHAAELNTCFVLPESCAVPCVPGQLDSRNANYVMRCLQRAVTYCQADKANALVTGPVNKAVINDAGIAFTGHTEWLAAQTNTDRVVMCLASDLMRVALVTTHMPLRAVADAITTETLTATLRITHDAIRDYFSDDIPCMHVLGLNPHAGEGGHLGREEIDIISPVIEKLNAEGYNIKGPLSADTAFVQPAAADADIFVAMYHDQGLPIIKQTGFGQTVNVTLGLPIIRTSVDHGTAHHLAATGKAKADSLIHAIDQAKQISSRMQSR